MAFSVGSEERVNELTKVIKDAGYPLLNGPRFTGDGYYESVIGVEGNQIKLRFNLPFSTTSVFFHRLGGAVAEVPNGATAYFTEKHYQTCQYLLLGAIRRCWWKYSMG